MNFRIPWLEFVAGCLATFRLALLIAKEDGPADAAKKLRLSAPAGWIRRGFSCEWWQSFWWGMAVALREQPDRLLKLAEMEMRWSATDHQALAFQNSLDSPPALIDTLKSKFSTQIVEESQGDQAQGLPET